MRKALLLLPLLLITVLALAQTADQQGKIPGKSARISYATLLKQREAEIEEMEAAGINMEESAEGPEIQLKRWKWKMEQQVDQDGYVVPFAQIVDEWERYRSKHCSSKQKTTTPANWILEGPKTSPSEYSYLGRINTVAFDPLDSNTFYAGTPGGSLWKTSDGGNTWTPLYTDMPSMGVTDVKINPLNRNTIYVVTGDIDGYSTSSMGVIVSRDGGATWSNTALTWGPGVNTATTLLINPLDTNKMMLGTYNGLYRTYNAGASWTIVNSLSYRQLIYNPADTSVVYGTTFFITGHRPQILRSGNGGTTWDSVTTFTNTTRIALAVTPAAPSNVKALVAGTIGYIGLYSSTDFGLTYTPIDTGNSSCTHNLLGWDTIVSCMNQGSYDLCIAVSPTDPNKVVIGGVTSFLSPDGGSSWLIANEWGNVPGAPHVHPDKHFLGYNPLTGGLFEGCDGGIHKTHDPLAYWKDLTNGMSITEFYHCATANGISYCLGGAQDNGTMKLSGGVANIVKGYDGFEVQVNHGDPAHIFYVTDQYGAYITRDGGGSFKSITDTFHAYTLSWWLSRKYFALHPTDTATLLMGYGNRLYASYNNGISWTPLAPTLDTSSSASSLKLFSISPKNPNYIYAAMAFGANKLHFSTNFGTTWDSTWLPSSPQFVTDLVADPRNENKLWVSLNSFFAGNILWSYDKTSNTWTNESGSLPAMPVNCIVIDSSSGTAYVGDRAGVFYRAATMSDWAP